MQLDAEIKLTPFIWCKQLESSCIRLHQVNQVHGASVNFISESSCTKPAVLPNVQAYKPVTPKISLKCQYLYMYSKTSQFDQINRKQR